MISVFKWLKGFFRLENIKAAIGSIKRRLLGWGYLEMRIDLAKHSVPAQDSLDKDVRIGGYSETIQAESIDLLNSVTSLGLWNNSNFQQLLHSVDDPGKDIFVLYEKDYPVGFTVAHKKNLSDNSVEVGYIAVRPKSRGKQYGFKLLKYVILELKKRHIAYVFLRSDSFRIPALKTYLKCGFVPYPRNENQKKRWQNVMKQINRKNAVDN
jgi:GNAT superfamily N-acetyltransferase